MDPYSTGSFRSNDRQQCGRTIEEKEDVACLHDKRKSFGEYSIPRWAETEFPEHSKGEAKRTRTSSAQYWGENLLSVRCEGWRQCIRSQIFRSTSLIFFVATPFSVISASTTTFSVISASTTTFSVISASSTGWNNWKRRCFEVTPEWGDLQQ